VLRSSDLGKGGVRSRINAHRFGHAYSFVCASAYVKGDPSRSGFAAMQRCGVGGGACRVTWAQVDPKVTGAINDGGA
jgi:hypothetical protein